jgi:hypothetical protein
LDPEAGLARGCGERAHQESSSKHLVIVECPENRQPPTRGICGRKARAAALQTTCWRQGLKGPSNKRAPPHLPFPLRNCGRSAVSPATHPVGGPGGHQALCPRNNGDKTGPHTTLATTRIVRDTRRPPYCRPGSLKELGKGPGANPPPVPSLQYCDWRLRDSSPGMASASMGSFFSSSDFLFLLPFLCLPGELRALALLGAPLLPLPSGAPPLPRHPGAKGGRHFPPLPFRERDDALHHPPEAAPLGPGEVQRRHPPHPGGHDAAVPRRLSSAPPIPLLAPPGSCPGDWETAAADPGGPVSHEAGRLTDLDRDMLDLRTYINRYGHFC